MGNIRNKAKDLIKKGDSFLQENKLSEADACYREALELDSDTPEALYSIGCVASHRGDFVAAEAWARKAIAENPDYKAGLYLLGNTLFGQDRFKEALDVLLSATPGEGD